MATSIPSLKPDSESVSGGKGIISELPTLRTLRVMIMDELYNVIWPREVVRNGASLSEGDIRLQRSSGTEPA